MTRASFEGGDVQSPRDRRREAAPCGKCARADLSLCGNIEGVIVASRGLGGLTAIEGAVNFAEAALIRQAQMNLRSLTVEVRLYLHGESIGGVLKAKCPIAIELLRHAPYETGPVDVLR